MGRAIILGIVGALAGSLAGGLLGLGGGLLWTMAAGTSQFEGYAGVVVALWLLAGAIIGVIAGAVIGVRKARA